MYLLVNENLQIGLDCAAPLSARRGVIYGWVMAPRGAGTELAVAGRDGTACPIEYCSFHQRPDVPPKDPRAAVVNGFTLIFATPPEVSGLRLIIQAGEQQIRVDLADPSVETNPGKATAERSWRTTFALFGECADNPGLEPLLAYRGRPCGVFAEWLGRLPLLRGRAEKLAGLAELEALASPAGEILLLLRPALVQPAAPEPEAVALAQLRLPGGEGIEQRPVRLLDWHARALPEAAAAYGRLAPEDLDRLHALEAVVQVQLGEERQWFRCQPRPVTVPEFLDAACRLGLPAEAGAPSLPGAGLAMLRQVIARREAAFAPTLSALASAGEAGPGGATRLLLILGADEPTAARLFQVTAEEVERRCEEVLVMGEAAEEVAQVFARRGRITARLGAEAAQGLREAAGRGGLIALDATRYAEAVIAGRPGDAFTHRLDAGELARLLTLHAVAGRGTALGDSLQLLLRLREAGREGFMPLSRAWTRPHAADLVQDHLLRLWQAGAAPAEESLAHG